MDKINKKAHFKPQKKNGVAIDLLKKIELSKPPLI